MIINQLPSVSSAADADEIVVEIGTTTYKIKKSDFLKEFMKKSGGEFTGDVTVNGVLDVTPRRCYATLSSAGWYRVMKYQAGDSGDLLGGRGLVVDFNIQRATFAENHSITMRCVSGSGISFENERSKSNEQYITKIRYSYDSTNLVGYVDIYNTGTISYLTGVDFVVHGAVLSAQSAVTAESLQYVGNSPSGETVLTEYTFAANTEGTITTPSAGVSGSKIIDSSFIRSGKVVSYHMSISSVTSSDIDVTSGDVLASGLVPPYSRVITIGHYWYDTSKPCLRCQVTTTGNLEVYWDSGVIPKSGQSVVFEITYIAA